MLPTPITPLVSWSLGAMYPRPRTWRGTTLKSAKLPAVLRKVLLFVFMCIVFLIAKDKRKGAFKQTRKLS
jgi:hypothetical protein